MPCAKMLNKKKELKATHERLQKIKESTSPQWKADLDPAIQKAEQKLNKVTAHINNCHAVRNYSFGNNTECLACEGGE